MSDLDRRFASGVADRATREVMFALGSNDSLLDVDETERPDAIPDAIRGIIERAVLEAGRE